MHKSFDGVLTVANIKQHIDHVFDVPENTTALSIHLEYSPGRVTSGMNMLTLTVFDANGFRGAGHRGALDAAGRASHQVDISTTQATPGYMPGPLPAGRWTVVIDTHSILADELVAYTLDITGVAGTIGAGIIELALAKPTATAKQHVGWYRGDLHAHTVHSDALWDVPTFAAFMRDRHLDFATLSDHNTVSGLAEWDQMTSADFLTIAAVELTTFYGHCLALGLRKWVDWRIRPGQRSMVMIAGEVTANGALFVIAHPTAIGDPVCTGCDWVYADMQPGSARVVEIWNTQWEGESNNEDALRLWYAWLNQGYRMVATSGTDAHGPFDDSIELGFDVVYAEALTEPAILHAIRQGHLYMSSGPALELTGTSASGATAMMGDNLPHEATQITATWDHCTVDERLILIADGKPLTEEAEIRATGRQTWSFAAGQARWCTVEVRDRRNHLRAVANPLFMGW